MRTILLSSLIATAIAAPSAHAADLDTLEARMEAMEKQHQQEIQALKAQIRELQKKPQSTASAAPVASKDNPLLLDDKGLGVKSADGNYSARVFGHMQVDNAFFQDDNGNADHPDGTTLREVRLGVKGKAGEDWGYKFLAEFGNDDLSLKDAYLTYEGLDLMDIKVGQFKEPFSMDQLTSFEESPFVERGSLASLVPSRTIGLGVHSAFAYGSATGGIFGQDVGTKKSDDEGYSLTGRLTAAPIHDEDKTLHVGLGGSYRTPNQDTDTLRYRSKAENAIDQDYMVDTGTMANVNASRLLGLELAGSYKPVWFQSEFVNANVERETGPDADFSGYYVQAGWILTGETRPYDVASGVFKTIKPATPFSLKNGGIGAWEVLARYSSLDLTDAGITGGEMDNTTFALNWYPNNNLRLMANYIIANSDSNAVVGDDDPQIFLMRAQVQF